MARAWQNVPPNLLNAMISVPRAYLDALDDVSHALEVTGSWWVYTPTNVLGYDPADPPKITSITNLLIPFQAAVQRARRARVVVGQGQPADGCRLHRHRAADLQGRQRILSKMFRPRSGI